MDESISSKDFSEEDDDILLTLSLISLLTRSITVVLKRFESEKS